jgi:CO dehydrogenase nickel-insertion accessory protein CooC1
LDVKTLYKGGNALIIAVWGRGGSGKSVLAKELGRLYAKGNNVTVVIDTDMTQPTLPPKLPGGIQSDRLSLGAVFAAPYIRDARKFLNQHPKEKNLFYVGLTKNDDYLSYEIDMRQYEQAKLFIETCEEITDVIILDCSSQRGDPFLAVATNVADQFIMTLTPDTNNACWYHAVKPLLIKLNNEKKSIKFVASPVKKHHSIPWFQKQTDIKFVAELPYSNHICEADGQGNFASCSSDYQGRMWQKQLGYLVHSINEE